MNPSPRLAAASGAAALGVAALLLSQRFSGTFAAVVLLAAGVAAAAEAVALASPTESVRLAATRSLATQIRFAPALTAAVLAACVRSGSAVVADVAGAHAVAGVGLVRGPIATVVGMCLAFGAATIAAAGMIAGGDTQEPYAARRLRAIAGALLVVVVAALFAGPQISQVSDVIPWVIAAAGAGAWTWFGRAATRLPAAPMVAALLGLAGLALVVAGGQP